MKGKGVIDAAYSALSNLYHSKGHLEGGGAICYGQCSLKTQLTWAQGLQAWRMSTLGHVMISDYQYGRPLWEANIDMARQVIASPFGSYTNWGDVESENNVAHTPYIGEYVPAPTQNDPNSMRYFYGY